MPKTYHVYFVIPGSIPIAADSIEEAREIAQSLSTTELLDFIDSRPEIESIDDQ